MELAENYKFHEVTLEKIIQGMDMHAKYVLKNKSTGIVPTEYKEAELTVYDEYQNTYILCFSIIDCGGVFQMTDWHREADVIMIDINELYDGEEGEGYHCIFNDSEKSKPSSAYCRNSWGTHKSIIKLILPTEPVNEDNDLERPKGVVGAYYVKIHKFSRTING